MSGTIVFGLAVLCATSAIVFGLAILCAAISIIAGLFVHGNDNQRLDDLERRVKALEER